MAREKRESVFTISEQESIEIDQFIFHVIIAGEEEPRYLDKVTLTRDQLSFFKKRFLDASTGTRFIFKNKQMSSFYNECLLLLDNDETDFTTSSKALAFSFNQWHKGSANDGIFIVSTVRMIKSDEEFKLVFLIKMDHRAVYRYKLDGNEATFEEIINTVVEEKNAMQKVAIVDIGGHFSWEVLAADRTKTDGVAGYFENFLTVKELEPDSTLTRQTVAAVKRWAVLHRAKLPTGQTPNDYKDRATDYMLGNSVFESEKYLEVVVGDKGDSEKIEWGKDSLRQYMMDMDLYGTEFRPRPNSLRGKENRNVLKTEEGVTLEWLGTKESKNLEIPERRNLEDNLYHLIIKTNKLIEEGKL